MEKRIFNILGILLMLMVSSKSRVIPRDIQSGDGETSLEEGKFNKDKSLEPKPESLDPEDGEKEPTVYEVDRGVNDPDESPDYDDRKPGKDEIDDDEADKKKPGIIKPEIIPPSEETGDKDEDYNENAEEEEDDKKTGEEGFYEPFDGEKDSDKSVGDDDDDSKIPEDEIEDESHSSEDDVGGDKGIAGGSDVEDVDKKMSEEGDGDDDGESDSKGDVPGDYEEKSDETEDDKEDHVPESDEKSDEDDKADHVPESDEESDEDDKEDHVPESDEESDEDDKKFDGSWKSGFFSGGSIFHRPFFSLNQVRKYFNQMERALGHAFTQTLNEAILLNGTYANTTEEEVDIDGKKYVVQKSVIKGSDNHSTIYVETLSSKPKKNDMKNMKDAEVNVTGV